MTRMARTTFFYWLVCLALAATCVSAQEDASDAGLGVVTSDTGAFTSDSDLHLKHGAEISFNNTPIDVVDITDGESMIITFFLDDPLPLGLTEVILQENSPDYFGHVDLLPDRWLLDDSTLVKTDDGRWKGSFNITGTFLGFSKILFLLKGGPQNEYLAATKEWDIKIQRSDKFWDFLFTMCMVTLVAIAYINMGCAIDLDVIKEVLKKPIAPIIGLCSQYFFMPITSYLLGYLLFYDKPAQWLGLFMIGCSPGGGGSNMWTFMLGGSLDLSVTMTLISTIVAFVALPIWVYALATNIFREGNFSQLPYGTMAGMVVGLIVPCAVGVLIRRFLPKVADFLKKMLKPVALVFILFVSTVGIYINLYIFSFFTGRVILVGILLPWLGFLFGGIVSYLFKRKWEEIIAISVETGIQNTGLAIGVIKFAMQDFAPLGDLTVVMPIAVVSFTPLPLLVGLIAKKIYSCIRDKETAKTKRKEELSGIDGPMQQEESGNHKMPPSNIQYQKEAK